MMSGSRRNKSGTGRPDRRALWRALDANANRAREGLRVAEDVARFLWNDASLTADLKKVRHALTSAEKTLFAAVRNRLAARDVEGDEGRTTREKSEKTRRNASDLFVANLKRSQEAFRGLEEFSKALGRPEAERFKKLRYETYQLEIGADKHM